MMLTKRYLPEIKERAVQMVAEHRSEHESGPLSRHQNFLKRI